VGELEVPESQAALILRAVALMARTRHRAELRRYPACVAVSLATFAGAHYSGGALWESLFQHVDIPDTPEERTAIGGAFLDALSKLDLPTVEEGLHYLGPITFHAVIPDYCLRDVLVLLAQRLRQNPSLDGHSFLAWAGGHPSRLAGLDVPARRFLNNGGEYAADLVDRLLDLLAALGEGTRDVDELISLAGAPARMVRKAVELAESERLEFDQSSTPRPRTMRSGSVEGPHVVLDLERSSVLLRLPQWEAMSDDPVHWRVMLDGVPSETHGSTGAHEDVVVARPIRTLSAALGSETQLFEMDLVRADFPMLAFDRMGRFIPGSNPLPDDEVWLLYPEVKGAPEADDEPIVAAIRLLGPIGWNGWALDRVTLTTCHRIGWGDTTRVIHHRGRPQLETIEPVPGLRTRSGQPLLARRPLVSLPRLATATDWRVEVRDAKTGKVLAENVWTNDARAPLAEVESWIDVFDGWPDAVVGEFDILVRGPLGTRANWRVAIAEGLQQRTSVYCRTFVAGGLTPMAVDWGGTAALAVHPNRHEFAAPDRVRNLTVHSGELSLDLECEPNHLEVCRVSGGEASDWSAAPLTLPSDGNEDLGFLEVRMAADQLLPPLLLVCGSGLTQTLPATGGAGARQRFDLARIADTLRSEKVATLQWPIGEVNTTLAIFRPDRLCSGVALDGDDLVLRDFAGVSDASAGLYQLLAPWRTPTILPMSTDGRAPITDDLALAGPLLVHVRLDDPWVPTPWPRWPDKAFSLGRDGWPQPANDAEGAAIHYLAGNTAVPEDAGSFPYLWVAWERANELVGNGATRTLRDDIPARFARSPGAAIEALLSTDVPRELALVMGMGATMFFTRSDLAPNVLEAVWRRFPALASTARSATADLPWDQIVTVCGPVAEAAASGDTTWSPHLARFDNASLLNAMTSQKIDQLWRAAQVVPAGLLDVDTRAAAGMALFQTRHKRVLESLLRDGPALVHATDVILKDAGQEGLRDWVRARVAPRTSWDWELIPQLSATFAAMARMAARGDQRAAHLSTRFVGEWQTLARTAPDIVEIDIVLAEMLTRAKTEPYQPEAEPVEGAA
jgi:hypothetical protein